MKAKSASLKIFALAPHTFVLAAFFLLLLGVAHAECVLGPPLEASRHVRITTVAADKPLEGAKVFFRPTLGCICAPGYPLDTSEMPQEYWRLTDAKGVADLPELTPGYYDVGVSMNDVATSFIQIHVANKNEVTTFPVDVGLQVSQLEAVPLKSHMATFQGIAQDPSGAAIPGRIVVVRKATEAKDVVLRTQTDAEGFFRADLSDGLYIAVFFSPGFRPAIVPFEVTKDGSNEGLVATLRIGGCP